MEFLAKVGPLLIVVAYAPTDQDSTDRFCSDLDRVISNGNGLAMVMADFIASVSERMKRVVESHGVGRCTSDNGLAMVMADFNASVSERMKRVVESHGVGRCTSDNGERHVSFCLLYTSPSPRDS